MAYINRPQTRNEAQRFRLRFFLLLFPMRLQMVDTKGRWVTFWVVENYHGCSFGTEKAVSCSFSAILLDVIRTQIAYLQPRMLEKPVIQGFSQ